MPININENFNVVDSFYKGFQIGDSLYHRKQEQRKAKMDAATKEAERSFQKLKEGYSSTLTLMEKFKEDPAMFTKLYKQAQAYSNQLNVFPVPGPDGKPSGYQRIGLPDLPVDESGYYVKPADQAIKNLKQLDDLKKSGEISKEQYADLYKTFVNNLQTSMSPNDFNTTMEALSGKPIEYSQGDVVGKGTISPYTPGQITPLSVNGAPAESINPAVREKEIKDYKSQLELQKILTDTTLSLIKSDEAITANKLKLGAMKANEKINPGMIGKMFQTDQQKAFSGEVDMASKRYELLQQENEALKRRLMQMQGSTPNPMSSNQGQVLDNSQPQSNKPVIKSVRKLGK